MVFGEVFPRLFADLTVEITLVSGGTCIFLTVVFILDWNF